MRAVENGIDEQLLVEAAQRDPACFAQLYEGNFERVYGFIARRVSSREEAQDLTAEVFHKALASLHSFRWNGTPFVAWLVGIANNVLAAHWKRNAKCQEISSDHLEIAGADDGTEQRTAIAQLVDGLPEDQRLVIVRRFVDQRSLRDVAVEMNRSEGAIKQLQLRALRNLRTKMRGTS